MEKFLDWLQIKEDLGRSVYVLGFSSRPEKAKIKKLFSDCAEIEFVKNDSDESIPYGKYIVPFSVMVLKR
ncbi:hypothetical protein KAJ61_00390 [Candidatus Parcubacteria bacterium]|nr:hypothetical protein [Candidatus Parcubacteria bacterium]